MADELKLWQKYINLQTREDEQISHRINPNTKYVNSQSSQNQRQRKYFESTRKK